MLISVVLVSLILGSSAHAQPEDLPPLVKVDTAAEGRLVLFYPATWSTHTNGERLTVSDGQASQITAWIAETNPLTVDDLPDWLIAEDLIPENAFFEPQSYGGYAGWLAQGDGLLTRGEFIAVAALLISPGQVVVFDSRFPSAELSKKAALVTAILHQLILLPDLAETETFNLGLPKGWFYAESDGVLFAAPDETDWQRYAVGEVPDGLAISIQVVQAQNVEDRLSSLTALEVERQTLTIGGIATIQQIRQDQTIGASELVLIALREDDAYLELRASSADREQISKNLPLLQAIFASLHLR
jgi:hypothetical protein